MKVYIYLFTLFGMIFSVFSQNRSQTNYEVIKERVSKTFFVKPLEALDDAYLLKDIAKSDVEVVTAYKYLGYIYDLTGNSDSARFYFSKELQFAKKRFNRDETHYQAVINFCNWGINNVDGKVVIQELTEALSTIDETKYKQQKGLMYMLIGDVLLKDFEYDKAESYFDMSFKLIKGKYVKVDYFMRKAEVDFLKSDYKSAKSNLISALNSLDTKEIFTYPQILNELGDVSLMLENYSEAKSYLEESLFYQNKNSFKAMSSETYLNLYRLDKKLKPKLDKYFLDKALASHNGDLSVLKKIYLEYKEYYSIEKNTIKEAEFFKKFNQLNDSIFSIEKVKVKADIESRYQFNENKKELALKENIIQKDRKIKTIYFLGIIVLGVLIIVLIVIYFNKIRLQKKFRKNQKLLHEEQLKLMLENQRIEIIKEKIKSKAEERGKLSIELHDGIANEISVLKLSLATESNLSKAEIDELVKRIDKLYAEIRNLSHNLDPENIADIEFSQFVENLCTVLEKNGLKTIKNLYITKKIDDLEDTILVNIYRIIQEVVNNILKHSKASIVVFDIIESENTLYINIKDNGLGFDFKETKKGIGLKNINKRVASFNGNFEIETKNGIGTEVKISLSVIK